ncbi:Por secretion system C-terminal sorting domain-containing protein [Paenimyroides ummariense]|uniref:Por secretion system C-terminal sorting domain-containing protein n=1 Tax=Paenimyroides ummariense TaxID=913024 RepID=A0A1I5FEG9_9FLAO|nr:T9SS type A sorting domain-containing protein [Paenimyroides ummariense]SFO22178.1 Por secretion system C-terminal sorting domain-containing protein [Paenimyroides ummariense]
MNNFYATKKRLTSLCLLAIGLISFNANSQCTAVATINETFDAITAMPNCWNKSGNVLFMGNAAVMYSGGAPTTGGVIYLISPELSTIDGNHLLEYVLTTAAPNNNGALEIGTMSDNTDFTTFSAITTPTPNGGTYTTAAIPANSGHKYIAFKFTYTGVHQGVTIDNVEWKTALSTSKFDTSKVTVYPNPTSGIFNVDSELNIAKIEVFNSTGQKVLATANKEINLQSAANGLYFITVTTNEGTQGTYKLIKK